MLQWHLVSEKPPLETASCSVDVILKTNYKYAKAYYEYDNNIWVTSIPVESHSKWMPMPKEEE